MVQITEQQIIALAPNAAAVSNGRKISQKGGFVKLMKSKDETLIMGECSGSGKSNYFTSADYIDEENPVFRCSCPSRQFPCKHSIGLMFEMMSLKDFEEAEIPEDILRKREKLQAKSEKKEIDPENMTEEEKEKAKKAAARAKKASDSAKAKKTQKQLEGLEVVQKMLENLLSAGLTTMGGTSIKSYQDISKQLGDYYLPGPQKLMNHLILEVQAFQKDQNEVHYDAAIEVVKRLWNLTKKSKIYLQGKLNENDMTQDDNILYEELGGIWKLTELEEAGCGLLNGNYAQLAFFVEYDEAAKEYVDYGVFIDLNSGEIYLNKNIRPVKSMKHLKEEDSLFGVASASRAAFYPGDGNKRIRWDGCTIRDYEASDLTAILNFAKPSVVEVSKEIKNVLKNTLSNQMYLKLIAFDKVGKTKDGQLILWDKAGEQIVLSDLMKENGSCGNLELIPSYDVIRDQVMLLAFYENREKHRIEAQPISIVSKDKIVRLLY